MSRDRFGGVELRVVERVDARAVLRADVVALAHALRGVVVLPEQLEQLVVRDHRGVEHHEHRFGVSGVPAAHLHVRRVRRVAPRRSRLRCCTHPRPARNALGAPEAAHREHRLLERRPVIGREGRAQRVAVDEVLSGTGIDSSRPGSASSRRGISGVRLPNSPMSTPSLIRTSWSSSRRCRCASSSISSTSWRTVPRPSASNRSTRSRRSCTSSTSRYSCGVMSWRSVPLVERAHRARPASATRSPR